MKKNIYLFYALFSAFVWGISFTATKVALNAIPPFMIAFFRFILAYIFLEIVSFLLKIKETIKKEDRRTLFFMALSGITFYYAFENYGLKYTSAANSSLIISTIPLFTLLINRFFLKESLKKHHWIGIFTSLTGIYILLFGFSFSFHLNWKGDMIMFLSVVSWISYTYFTTSLKNNYNMITITKELSYYGILTLIPFTLYEKFHYGFCIMKFTWPTIFSILFLGIICSAIAYWTWNKALTEGDVKITNTFIYLIPLFAIISEQIILKTLPPFHIYIAATLIIMGLFITKK